MTTKCESEEQFVSAVRGDRLVVVDFFAVWCPPCQYIAPILDQMAAEYEDRVTFMKVDVDELDDLALGQGIEAMPTFAFWKNGEKLEDFAGANEDKIRSTISKYL